MALAGSPPSVQPQATTTGTWRNPIRATSPSHPAHGRLLRPRAHPELHASASAHVCEICSGRRRPLQTTISWGAKRLVRAAGSGTVRDSPRTPQGGRGLGSGLGIPDRFTDCEDPRRIVSQR